MSERNKRNVRKTRQLSNKFFTKLLADIDSVIDSNDIQDTDVERFEAILREGNELLSKASQSGSSFPPQLPDSGKPSPRTTGPPSEPSLTRCPEHLDSRSPPPTLSTQPPTPSLTSSETD